MGVIATIVGSIVAGLLVAELYAWGPKISTLLLRLAIRAAPSGQRGRLSEEWHAHFAEMPGGMVSLISAVGFLFSSVRLTVAKEVWAAFSLARLIWDISRDDSDPSIKLFRLHRIESYFEMIEEGLDSSDDTAILLRVNERTWRKLSDTVRRRLIDVIERQQQI